jgi:hypothetical protein
MLSERFPPRRTAILLRFSRKNFDLECVALYRSRILKALGPEKLGFDTESAGTNKPHRAGTKQRKAKALTRQRSVYSWRMLREASELGTFQWKYCLVTSPHYTENRVTLLPVSDSTPRYRKNKDRHSLLIR